MPYAHYNRLTDADTAALVAFLRSLPALDNRVERPRSIARRAPEVARPANAPDPVDDLVGHGEYLVTLMHCNTCHASPGSNGAPDMTRPFAGGREMQPFGAGLARVGEEKLFVPNITPDRETGIGSWTVHDIARSVKSLQRPDGSLIRGPMQFYLAGWAAIEDRDLQAIAAYLKQIPPVKNRVPKPANR